MWTEDRCPTCGKLRSAPWWNQNTAASPPSVPMYVLPTSATPSPVFIPYANPAAAAPQLSASYYLSSDLCWCPVSVK